MDMDKGLPTPRSSGRILASQERADARTTRQASSNASSADKQRVSRYRVGFQDSTIRAVTPESIREELEDTNESLEGEAAMVSPSTSPRSIKEERSKDRSGDASVRSGWNGDFLIGKPTKESSSRPRTRTLEERPRDQSPSSFLSRTRHRIGSVHATPPTSFSEQSTAQLTAIVSPGGPSSKLPPSPRLQIHATNYPGDRNRSVGRQRIVKPLPGTSSPATRPPSISDSLPSPIPTADANKILQLMKTSCGRMQGNLEFKTEAVASWSSGYCYINEEAGSLVHEKKGDKHFQKTLVPDLRGCQIRTSVPEVSKRSHIGITTHTSGLEVQIRTSSLEQFDSWLAALLCWQPIRPKGAQNKMTKPQTPVISAERRLGDRRRNSDASISKDAAIIKVGKMLLWDRGNLTSPASTMPGSSHGQRKLSYQPWRKVSCILQENGEFKLYTETDVTLLSVIQLSQLSRCAVQKLDRSVLDEEFCIGIYPQYTSTSTSLSLIRPIYLSLESRVLFEVWFVLLRAFTIPELYGPEQMDNGDLSSSQVMRGLFATSTADMFRVERSLSLRIVEAKMQNLRARPNLELGSRTRLSQIGEKDTSIADYFCEVWLDGEVRARTVLKSNTNNPFWREDYEFSDLPAVLSRASIILKRRESGQKGSDMAIANANFRINATGAAPIGVGPNSWGLLSSFTYGKLEIDLDDLEYGKEAEGWWPIINPKEEKVGELLVKLRAEELVVLMSRDYQPLSQLLHEFSNGLTLQIARLIPSELRRLSEILLDVFQVSGQASEWLMTLVEDEIDGYHKEPSTSRLRFSKRIGSNDSYDSTSDRELLIRDLGKSATMEANLLFRGNSLLTKALDLQMKRLGKEYLEETLCEKLREIQNCDLDCEVDPARVQSTEELGKNWRNLFKLTEAIWDSIYNSVLRCPIELRIIFRHIRACAEDRYGDFLRTITYSSVSGFLFLRFFCPAVLNPKLFGLLKEHPQPKAQRTLTLIAKSLQGLANMSSFGAKEPWMEPMNRFITSHRQQFKDFIDTMCSVSSDHGSSSAIPPSYATPITILARLPPTSREGFPSLPYLIDHARTFAALVTLWLKCPSRKSQETLDGDILKFHDMCVDLQRRTSDCLAKAEQAERPSSHLSFKWEELIEQLENHSPTEASSSWVDDTGRTPEGIEDAEPESPGSYRPGTGNGIPSFHTSKDVTKQKLTELVDGLRKKAKRGLAPASEEGQQEHDS